MALSQIQCLDEHNINRRINESKAEFFYSEGQRLALEMLLHEGREAFQRSLEEQHMRPFLSQLEVERLSHCVEVYNPGGEGQEQSEETTESLQYWPDRSDRSAPELDLGWPDCVSFRGVTRANVYTQPPTEGQTHIKEVVRKTIAQAQKVIAVVMDVFTDIDIFRDLLDAGFKRKVAVYIILEETGVPHFISMCQKAGMHQGHLKNLRIRCTRGMEFYTRSSKKVFGSMAQRFMFVDGDRAVSGSYSFTWMASRLDRNLITVLTGQAVEVFDRQFQELYLTSEEVSLSHLELEKEPELERIPLPNPTPPPSGDLARKLVNPKYALVSGSAVKPDSLTSSGRTGNGMEGKPVAKVLRRPKEIIEPMVLHPGLKNLEKVNLMPYLPTWPDPDPPSDVIGFINIRDSRKPLQVHLTRSELFETSQAVRFKSPFAVPEEILPKQATLEVTSKDKSSKSEENERETHLMDKTIQKQLIQKEAEESQTPPVPKRRTVHLQIGTKGGEDNIEISVVKIADNQSEMLSSQLQESSLKILDGELDSTQVTTSGTSFSLKKTETEFVPMKEETNTEKIDQKDKQEVIEMESLEASSTTNAAKGEHLHLDRKDSSISTTSDEFYECCDCDHLQARPKVMTNGISNSLESFNGVIDKTTVMGLKEKQPKSFNNKTDNTMAQKVTSLEVVQLVNQKISKAEKKNRTTLRPGGSSCSLGVQRKGSSDKPQAISTKPVRPSLPSQSANHHLIHTTQRTSPVRLRNGHKTSGACGLSPVRRIGFTISRPGSSRVKLRPKKVSSSKPSSEKATISAPGVSSDKKVPRRKTANNVSTETCLLQEHGL